jgi:hypothetical protein
MSLIAKLTGDLVVQLDGKVLASAARCIPRRQWNSVGLTHS